MYGYSAELRTATYSLPHAFLKMTYDDIRLIFEKVWDQIHERKEDTSKPAEGKRKKTLARKRASRKDSKESAKRQKLEEDTEKEELQVYLNIVPEEEGLDVESLATKQDVLELYKLVKERFKTASPEGYDLLLWGDLKTMLEPDDIWRNQQDWNLINWKLHNFCGVHVILIDTGLVIHIMVEKKYPLSQDTLSKMLNRRLEVDHQSEMGYKLIRFIRNQVLLQVYTADGVSTVIEDLVLLEKIEEYRLSH
ncbi:hypothetical protein Tco_0727628 [Tanacetum coccineum]|uniref:Uncharacterized protein n=1 Tax=Tanacetum coccineum TaxID=301880 RepID=A0ABQ4YJR1_9ASTR